MFDDVVLSYMKTDFAHNCFYCSRYQLVALAVVMLANVAH